MSLEQRTASTRARIRAGALAALALTVGSLLQPGATAGPLTFSGGPDGGIFQVFASGIADLLARRGGEPQVVTMASTGSLQNLHRVQRGEADFGIVYGADLYEARQGRLADDPVPYGNVQGVASLYQAQAQLVVRADAGIRAPAELTGQPVAVGPTGSGAAAAARRILGRLGLWEGIEPRFLEPHQGARALIAGEVAALWVLAAVSDASALYAATETGIRLLPLGLGADRAGSPSYADAMIPVGTYPGVDEAIPTIADTVLWVAGGQVAAPRLRSVLAAVFSDDGLNELRSRHPVARLLERRDALTRLTAPLHPGAAAFWGDHGIPAASPLAGASG